MGAAVDRFAHNSFALLAYAAIVRIYDLQLPSFDRSQGLWGFVGTIQSLLMTFGATLAVCLIGSRIPDWIDSGDRPGHRGFGHSLLSLVLFTIIALLASSQFVDQGLAVLYAVALAAGYLSHLALDFVTYEGVPWFWPLDEKYSLDLDSAGGLLVGFLGFLALVLSIYLLQDHLFPAVVLLLEA
jgi:Predicted membrane-bound metal-dependent hydrolases